MPAKRYIVDLTPAEREPLLELIHKGNPGARKTNRARILLKADEGLTDKEVATALHTGRATVERTRRRFVEGNLEKALNEDSRLGREPKLDGRQEAHLVALTCSKAPTGHADWSLRLLAEKAVTLEIVKSISHETVRQVLKRNKLKPWQKKMWCIPEAGAEFVAQMEAILDLYELPYDPDHPMVCFDEASKQLIAEKRIPLPAKPGQVERYDYEYERNGTRNLFMFFEPLANYRHVEVTERRTKQDFAHCMRWLVDERHPAAETVRVVMDNLNTHTSGALYEAFEPAEANRILKRLEFHYTPKHASWLNMAEIEFSVFERQCLKVRIPDAETLKQEVRGLEEERNTKQATVNWQFTSVDARIKLKRLYPSFSS